MDHLADSIFIWYDCRDEPVSNSGNQEDEMRSKDETLREALLLAAKNIVETEGPEAVNIRAIAKATGVASGTVYNYFTGKDDILLALTQEYWCRTLGEMEGVIGSGSFAVQLEEVYCFLNEHIRQSAGMLMGSLGGARESGRRQMQSMQKELNILIFGYLERDDKIREDVWDETFTMEAFAEFVTMNIMALLGMKEARAEFLLETVRRILY